MTSAPRSLVFVDTNVLLHFKPIQQIDWQSLFAAEGIDIADLRFVIAHVTLRELDKHKNEHRNATIRQRAGRVVKELEAAFVESINGTPRMIREKFPLIVQPHDREIDFDAFQLRRGSADDELLAAMLWHRAQTPEPALFLVSNDVGLRIAGMSRGMRVIVPADADQLPSDDDAITKELKALRLENATLKNKEPKLSLVFVAGANVETSDRMAVVIPTVPAEPAEAWAEAMANAAALVPPIPQPPASTNREDAVEEPSTILAKAVRGFDLALLQESGLDARSTTIEPKEYSRYAADRETYLTAYEHTLRKSWDLWNKLRRSFLVCLELQNTGSTPADEIDVLFQIPDGPEAELVSAFELEHPFDPPGNEPYIPAPRKPPNPPRTKWQVMMQPSVYSSAPSIPHIPFPGPLAPRGLVLRRTNSFEGDEQFKRLKHGYIERLGVLRLWFPPTVAPRGFQISYEITAANLATSTKGVLHVRVQDVV